MEDRVGQVWLRRDHLGEVAKLALIVGVEHTEDPVAVLWTAIDLLETSSAIDGPWPLSEIYLESEGSWGPRCWRRVL